MTGVRCSCPRCRPGASQIIFVARSCHRLMTVVDAQNSIRTTSELSTMGDTDTGHVQRAQALVDLSFLLDVEVRRALVQNKNLWTSI
jgi:hypothetical protein